MSKHDNKRKGNGRFEETQTVNGGQIISGPKQYLYTSQNMYNWIIKNVISKIPGAICVIDVWNIPGALLKPIVLSMFNVEEQKRSNIYISNGTTDTMNDAVILKENSLFESIFFTDNVLSYISEKGVSDLNMTEKDINWLIEHSRPIREDNNSITVFVNPHVILAKMWFEDNPLVTPGTVKLVIDKVKIKGGNNGKNGGGKKVIYQFHVEKIKNDNSEKSNMKELKRTVAKYTDRDSTMGGMARFYEAPEI